MPSIDVHDPGDLKRSRRLHKRRARKATRRVSAWQKIRQRERKLVARRNRQLKALKRKNSQRAEAVAWALAQVGTHEEPGRQNRGRKIDDWARDIGAWMVGQPWCGSFVWHAAKAAGLDLDKTTVSTVSIRSMAQRGIGGYRRWKPLSQVKPGDFIVYGTGGPQHVGIYAGGGKVVEGNTDPGRGGSQNDGGGVYVRTLAERRGWVLGVAEPSYKS